MKVMSRDKIALLLDVSTCRATSLNAYACDISTLAGDKVRLIQVWRQNHILYHILDIDRTGTFQYIHSEGVL